MMRTLMYLLIAIPLWYGAALTANSTISFLTKGLSADGVVTERVVERGCSKSRQCRIQLTIAFNTADGQSMEHKFRKHNVYLKKYNTGDQVPIRYKTTDPTQAIIVDRQTLWGGTMFFFSAAMSFSLLFIRRVLPVAGENSPSIKDLKLQLLIPVHFCFLLAIFALLIH